MGAQLWRTQSTILRFLRFSTSSSFDISFLGIHHTAREMAMISNIRIARNLVSLKSTIRLTYNGGLTSISQDEVGERQHESTPPSLIRYSSNPGGISSGSGTCPLIRVTRQVPQVPDVQFLGISTPASSAASSLV